MQSKWLEIILNILFWLLTSWLIISVNSIQLQEIEVINGAEFKQVFRSIDLINYFIIGQIVFCIIFYGELFFIQELGKTKSFKGFILKSIALIFLLMLVYYLIVRFSIFSEPQRISNISFGILILYVATALGYGFIKMWIKNEQDNKQLELVKNQTELKLLKSQLQPHFLFNTMNNLLAMVDQKSNPKLANSIDKLSGLLRYVVYDTKNEKVPIAQEILFLKNFAELHLLRFEEDEIDYSFNIKGDNDQQLIEPGILLCYIENAFKHGVQPEEKSFITIYLDISHKDFLHFTIKNSIPSFKPTTEKGGFGITSNTNRLKLAYPNKHSLEINKTSEYTVELKIETHESNHSG